MNDMTNTDQNPEKPQLEKLNGHAVWYLRDAKTLRIKAKLTMNKLSAAADVGRDTISKIEKKHPVSEIVAEKVFSALNSALNGSLDRDSHITRKRPQ
jgi:DNA-binding XRE family transcriptional regulator